MNYKEFLINFIDLPSNVVDRFSGKLSPYIILDLENILNKDKIIVRLNNRDKNFIINSLSDNLLVDKLSLCEYIINNRPELLLYWLPHFYINKKSKLSYTEKDYFLGSSTLFINDSLYDEFYYETKNQVEKNVYDNTKTLFSLNESLFGEINSITIYPMLVFFYINSSLSTKKEFNPGNYKDVDNFNIREINCKLHTGYNIGIVLKMSDKNIKKLKFDHSFYSDYLDYSIECNTDNKEEFEKMLNILKIM